MVVRFANQSHFISPRSPAFANARRKNQQMLQELAMYGREVETGKNTNNVKRITRKRGNRWSPRTAKQRANELAHKLQLNHHVRQRKNRTRKH